MVPDLNRDLLLPGKNANLNARELDRQISLLNALLYHVENWENFCTAHELIDINRRRIIRKPHLIQAGLRAPKAFLFTSNKN
ncbi:MAG: hypothetical protein JO301_18225 [Chitinophagaceae bacterium]|nr:hypothetical protein [Chitinophagaceae bacterium]